MRKMLSISLLLAFAIIICAGVFLRSALPTAAASSAAEYDFPLDQSERVVRPALQNVFSVEVLVDNQHVPEYSARGRTYVEALQNAEYELRIHNPTALRLAVALSVDGLNTIDARHTSSWDAHKWVIEPYGTINVRGWQMSSENARRFYFTTERDSYAAKLGQAANVGLISAVFFRERQAIILPVTPGGSGENKSVPQPRAPRTEGQSESAGQASDATRAGRDAPRVSSYPPPDDESAATGIGRSVRNDVQWIRMDLDPRPLAEVTIRYEYHEGLVRLGIIPRDYPRPDVLDRRERSQGFEPRYCPQP